MPDLPVFIQEAETTWDAIAGASKDTASFDVLGGDVLMALLASEDAEFCGTLTPSGGLNVTWEERLSERVNGTCGVEIWIGQCAADNNVTATVTRSVTATTRAFGMNVLHFRAQGLTGLLDSSGVSDPWLVVNPTQINTAVGVIVADKDAADGASRQWNYDAGRFYEKTYDQQASRATFYAGYHIGVPTKSTYRIGLLQPSSGTFSVAVADVSTNSSYGEGFLGGRRTTIRPSPYTPGNCR